MEKNYRHDQIEKEMQALWERLGVYRFDGEREGEVFSIDTPPPTVSGSLHIGHVFSYTQAEMVARFKRMQGCRVFYPFGFDDNGLPSERLVERDLQILARNLPRSEFIEKCVQTTGKYEEEFRALWRALGFSVDWSLQYKTVGPLVQKISQRSFLELAAAGRAYHKESPVLWCTQCQTSIAQAELDTKEADSTFCYIPFLTDIGPLEVATTRPELLYGCVCLFVNPEDTRYTHLIGKQAKVPLYDYDIPIYADELVGMDKGTGVVMCATFGDAADAQWFEKHSLPYRKVIMPDGRLAEDVPFVGGLRVADARKAVIRMLDERGLLLKTQKIIHAVAAHERCGQEVEIILSRQWYIDVLTERERFLRAADEINWYPAHMKKRYSAWVENLKWDWCISRQRCFGVAFPVWYCAGCGKPVFAAEDQLPVNPIETPYQGVCACGCTCFLPETAVFDTWATSSLTPQINAHFGEADDRSAWLLPMSMRTQAHEIIRTWAFYTIVKSLYHTGRIPWRDIMICGFVLAKKGEKISKSKGNSALSPQALLEAHGADALRYWAANSRLGTDTMFSPDDLDASRRFLTKLWNASKFILSHLRDYRPEDGGAELLPADRWIVARTDETLIQAAQELSSYETGTARHAIDELFWKDLCDNYIELAKERLYQPDLHGETERKSAQHALYYALLSILKMYAVFVPHIAEYIYLQYFAQREGCASIHATTWPKPEVADERLLRFGGVLKTALSDMRRYKTENNLSMRSGMEELCIGAPSEFEGWLALTEKDLLACSRAKAVKVQPL